MTITWWYSALLSLYCMVVLASLLCVLYAGVTTSIKSLPSIPRSLRRLRESADSISRWTIKRKGLVKSGALFVIVPFVAASVLIVPMSNRLGEHPIQNYKNVYVIEPIGKYDYWMRINGVKTYVNICKDLGYEPPFDSGETIEEMNVKNYGDCWSFNHDAHPKYRMARYADDKLIRKEN